MYFLCRHISILIGILPFAVARVFFQGDLPMVNRHSSKSGHLSLGVSRRPAVRVLFLLPAVLLISLDVMVVCVIEQASAVEHIDEIAAVPGIDVLFIGTSDLSFSLGLRGRQDEPLLEQAVQKVVAAARRHGKFLGRPAATPEEVQRYRAQGFQFFQSLTEIGLMELGAEKILRPPRLVATS
jgi:2-keto-3-deoxy-L-rhamnonate aldolase RhmA